MAAPDRPDARHDLDHLPGEDRSAAARLRSAPLEVVGRFLDASNATLLVRLTDRDARPLEELAAALDREVDVDDLDPDDLAVYKPVGGEAPLWDFPTGTLHRREVAAYEIAVALGWPLVPVTVLRDDAPFGPGSLQRFVVHDPERHYFHLLEERQPAVLRQLTTMVVFDLVINNADRKGGHVLLEEGAGDRIRLVDHGVSLHVQDKLRTVGWHLAGEPVPTDLRAEVAALGERLAGADLAGRLATLLAPDEVAALAERTLRVADLATFPLPTGPRPTPWPLL